MSPAWRRTPWKCRRRWRGLDTQAGIRWRSAPDIDIIEEPAWVIDQEIRLRVAKAPARVVLVPQQKAIPFRYESGYAICRVDKLLGHQAISFEGVTG